MNSECKKMFDECPSMLRMALAMDVLEGEFNHRIGFSALRKVANHYLTGAAISAEEVDQCQSELPKWIAEQELLQEQAWDLIHALEELMPLSDLDNMPSWPWTEWGKTLQLPWSEDLGDAVLEASIVLAQERMNR